MTQPAVHFKNHHVQSPLWVWLPLAGSVLLLVPALPISLGLSILALVAALATNKETPHRKLAVRLVLGWIALQGIVMAAGAALWTSFQG